MTWCRRVELHARSLEPRATGAGGRAGSCSGRRAPRSASVSRVRLRSTMCVPPCDVRREAHAAEARVAAGVHQDQPDERGGEQNVDDCEDRQHAAGRVADVSERRGVEDRAHEVTGDLILRHVAGRARRARPGESCVASEPVRTTRACPAARRGSRSVASMPSSTGIAMSIRTTSGLMLARELDRLAAVGGPRRRRRSARRSRGSPRAPRRTGAGRRRSGPAPGRRAIAD